MNTATKPPVGAPDLIAVDQVLREHLPPGPVRLAVVAMSRDDNPKAVVMATPHGQDGPALAVKVALTRGAAESVRAEAVALERLAGLDPTLLGGTVPRRIALYDNAAGTFLVTTVSSGRPLAVDYHRWHHTSRRGTVEADFRAADAWLTRLGGIAVQAAAEPGGPREPGCADELEARWADDELAGAAAQVCRRARERIGELDAAHLAHGDFWCGNILRSSGQVSGVVDWEHTRFGSSPVWDRVRFALAYTLYLDRHTRPGTRVHGHPGLTAGTWGEPVRYLLQGRGWYPECVGAFIASTAAGQTPQTPLSGTWRDAVLVGLGQVAAGSDQEDFARAHLGLLAELGS